MMYNNTSADRNAGHYTAETLKAFVWKVVNKEFTNKDMVDYVLEHGIVASLLFFKAAARQAQMMLPLYLEFDTKVVPCEQNDLLEGTKELKYGQNLDLFLMYAQDFAKQLLCGVRTRFWYPDVDDPEHYWRRLPYYYRDLTQQEIIQRWLHGSLPHEG